MIRLALAVGFLSVFGFVAYAIILLLTRHFKSLDKKNKKNKDSQLNNVPNDKAI